MQGGLLILILFLANMMFLEQNYINNTEFISAQPLIIPSDVKFHSNLNLHQLCTAIYTPFTFYYLHSYTLMAQSLNTAERRYAHTH